jgi:hypothetical protein
MTQAAGNPPARNEFLAAQYGALRSEILQLMQANENRTFNALSVAATIWAVLAALLGDGRGIPGVSFLMPLPILVLAFNTHLVHGRRVANLGSYLSAVTRAEFDGVKDWETEVGVFARSSNPVMSSSVSVATIYWFATATSTAVAFVVALTTERTPGWRSLDLLLTSAVALAAVLAVLRIHRGVKSYATSREEFDAYWTRRFLLPPSD